LVNNFQNQNFFSAIQRRIPMNDDSKQAELTRILRNAGKGDDAADNLAADIVYDQLKITAQQMMRWEKEGTMQPTALVNEALMRLLDRATLERLPDRAYFFAAAARSMRRILVDEARRRNSLKRGGDRVRQPFDELFHRYDEQNIDLLELNEALTELESLNQRQAKVVHLRWFVELGLQEIAELLEVSVSTIENDWRVARAFLFHRLSAE
jgi:RNA polymerase sigma factor (TIGR02999 family)